MAADQRITWLDDVSSADWIRPRLNRFCTDTSSVIPRGFQAYCRIFHPIRKREGVGATTTWAEVAARNGRIVHPEMQLHMISHPTGSTPPEYDLNDYINELDWGALPFPERALLVDVLRPATTTPERCWFCIWEGFGDIDFNGVTKRVQLLGRDYVLYSGPIDVALTALGSWDAHSPNLWWPEDRAWFVATEIDFAWTYVGGAKSLIESVVATGGLEALPAQLTDKPFFDSDTLNAVLNAK